MGIFIIILTSQKKNPSGSATVFCTYFNTKGRGPQSFRIEAAELVALNLVTSGGESWN